MNDFDRDINSGIKGGAKMIFVWIIAGAAALGLVSTAYFWVRPMWNSLETRGTENGYAAVSSKKELLLKLQQDWTKLESQRVAARNDPELAKTYSAQQIAIVNRMKIEAATLPAGEVPSEVQGLLH